MDITQQLRGDDISAGTPVERLSFADDLLALLKEARQSIDRTFFQKFIEGKLGLESLRRYYRHLWQECDYFVRLVSLVHSQAVDRSSRELVARNLCEEYGQGCFENNHPYLALKVGLALGNTEQEIEGTESTPMQRAYFEVLFDRARVSFVEGLAVVSFHESDLPDRMSKMKRALIQHYGVPAAALRYYDEHIDEGGGITDPQQPGYGGDDVHVNRQVQCIARLASTESSRQAVRDAVWRAAEARDKLNREYDRLCDARV